MTGPKYIAFLALLFLGGLTLTFIMGGVWFGSEEQTVFGTLTAIKVYPVFGLFKVPWVNWDFFTIGLPRLFQFNFSFFGGSFEYARYALYTLSIGLLWGIIVVVFGVIQGIFSRR